MATLRNKDKENGLREEIKSLKKRNSQLVRSLKRQKVRNSKLKAEQKSIKSALVPLKKGQLDNSYAKGHHYPIWVMKLSISLQVLCGLSYRQTKESLQIILLLLDIDLKSPSADAVRQWVQKQGCYELEKGQENEDQKVLIVDESAGIGREKALAILGIAEANWIEEPSALVHKRMIVCGLSTKNSWTGEAVSDEIQKVKGSISYVVSDGCSVMRKACRLSGVKQVLDCTHWMANCMERYYKKEEDFMALQKDLGLIRQKMVSSKYVGMIAPNLRSKARFLNLFEIVEWLEKVQLIKDNLESAAQKLISFVDKHYLLTKELIYMIKIIKDLSCFFKNEGITSNSIHQVQNAFSGIETPTDRIKLFKKDMLEYVQKIRETLPDKSCILCCSDVIESYFGKFKYRGNKAASQGITEDILAMSLFGSSLTKNSVKQAMESVSWANIGYWSKQNMVTSFSKTKLSFWSKYQPKNGSTFKT